MVVVGQHSDAGHCQKCPAARQLTSRFCRASWVSCRGSWRGRCEGSGATTQGDARGNARETARAAETTNAEGTTNRDRRATEKPDRTSTATPEGTDADDRTRPTTKTEPQRAPRKHQRRENETTRTDARTNATARTQRTRATDARHDGERTNATRANAAETRKPTTPQRLTNTGPKRLLSGSVAGSCLFL